MEKFLFSVAVVAAAALGCAVAAESPAPAVSSSSAGETVVQSPAKSRKLPPYHDQMGIPTVTPVRQRTAGAEWSIGDETNASMLAASPLPNDLSAVRTLHEQIRETLLVMVRRQVDMQVDGSDQLKNAREYRSKLRTEDPDLLKLQQKLVTLDNEREDVFRQIEERFKQDAQYQKLSQQRVNGLQKLRDMGDLISALREKMLRLEQRQAELERQSDLTATNQNQSATPAIITRQ